MQSVDNEQNLSVLLVEDDENILNLLSAYLESAGYDVVTATDGDHGLQRALEREFDICVLDVLLPGKPGTEIASAMQQAGCDTPILFLTALGAESDILRGFGVGADDYMVKPFSPRILLVRIQAILKRFRACKSVESLITTRGPIQLDDAQRVCLVSNRPVELTPHEYRILQQLMRRPERVFERHTLISIIYGNQHAVSPKAIDVHVHHLRMKLGEKASSMIQTVRGFGYKLSIKKHIVN